MTTYHISTSQRWIGLIGLGLVLMILNLDTTIINLALPAIGDDFNSTINDLMWINNSYTIALAATVMLISRIADNNGHRLALMFGIWTFFVGSFVGGLAPNEGVLIVGRVIMGIGMAATFPMVFILALRLFPKGRQAFAVGLLITFTGVSQAIGPSLGGLIVEFLGWRYTFLINPPICVLCFILIYWAMPKDPHKSLKMPIHYPSAALLFFALMFAITAINQVGFWPMSLSFSMMCIGLLLLLIMFIWQHQLRFPLINLGLFSDRVYTLLCIVRSLFQINFGILLFLLPLYLQNVQGLSPLHTGVVLLGMTAILGVAAPLSGWFTDRYQLRMPLIVSLLIGFVGFMLLLLQTADIRWGVLFIALFLLGIHLGTVFSITNYGVVAVLPKRKKGMGSGFFYTLAFFFISFGVGMTGLLLDLVSQHYFNASAVSQSINIDTIRPYLNASQSMLELEGQYPMALIETVRSASEKAWWSIVLFSTLLSLLNFGFGCLLKNPTVSKKPGS